MNRRVIVVCLGLCIILLGALTIFALRSNLFPTAALSAVGGVRAGAAELKPYMPPMQSNPPPAGWSVCVIGELEPIPDVGIRQVFELCHADGWRLKVYCLDPEKPIPELGTMCSQLVGGGYWCGDEVQQLGLLDVLQGAEDTPTPTATATATSTVTPTASATATQQLATETPTATLTATLGQETVEVTVTPSVTVTPTLRSTPYDRPQAGGPGNLPGILPLLGGLGTLLLAGRAAYAGLRRKGSRR